jgi:hypothetical protein
MKEGWMGCKVGEREMGEEESARLTHANIFLRTVPKRDTTQSEKKMYWLFPSFAAIGTGAGAPNIALATAAVAGSVGSADSAGMGP